MAMTEETRHHLISKLEDVLGLEEAFMLMEYLPPVGWADVATKRDLELLELRIRLDFMQEFGAFRDEMTQQFGAFRDEIHADRRAAQRQFIFVLVVALIGLAVSLTGVH